MSALTFTYLSAGFEEGLMKIRAQNAISFYCSVTKWMPLITYSLWEVVYDPSLMVPLYVCPFDLLLNIFPSACLLNISPVNQRWLKETEERKWYLPLLMTDFQIKESKIILITVSKAKLKWWKTRCYLCVLISCKSCGDREADESKLRSDLVFLNVQLFFWFIFLWLTPSSHQQLSVSLEKGKNCWQWTPEGFCIFAWRNGAAASN